MNKKVSAKNKNGKFWNYGFIKVNPWGNLQLSLKNTEELKKLLAEGGEWINFSLFDDERDTTTAQQPAPSQKKVTTDTQAPISHFDDELPF